MEEVINLTCDNHVTAKPATAAADPTSDKFKRHLTAAKSVLGHHRSRNSFLASSGGYSSNLVPSTASSLPGAANHSSGLRAFVPRSAHPPPSSASASASASRHHSPPANSRREASNSIKYPPGYQGHQSQSRPTGKNQPTPPNSTHGPCKSVVVCGGSCG